MHRLDHSFPTRSTESLPGLVDRLLWRRTESILRLVAVLTLIGSAPLAAATETLPQPVGSIEKAVREFALTQARAYGGEPRIEVGAIDPHLRLTRCDQPLIVELPSGSRPIGSTTVGVRCPGSSPWSLYVPVRVQIYADILVAAHPLARGVPLTETDVALSRQDLATVPGSALTHSSQVVGKRLRYPVATGAALNAGLLDLPPLVKRGQTVTIVSAVHGLEVRATGEALADGANGETIRVRNLLTKKIIQGTVQDSGLVRVSM